MDDDLRDQLSDIRSLRNMKASGPEEIESEYCLVEFDEDGKIIWTLPTVYE